MTATRLIASTLFCLVILAPRAGATPILINPLATPNPTGGFAIGTTRDGETTLEAAQRFVLDADLAVLYAAVPLRSNGPATISFQLAADNAGVPGTAISSAIAFSMSPQFDLTQFYGMSFSGASLTAGNAYWLVATSPTVGNMPLWPTVGPSTEAGVWLAWMQDGLAWNPVHNDSLALVLSDASEEEAITTGLATIVPEPSTLLLSAGALGLVLGRRRRRPRTQ